MWLEEGVGKRSTAAGSARETKFGQFIVQSVLWGFLVLEF